LSDAADFTLQPEGATTRVTWAMRGPATFVTKIFGVLVSMDGMIGTTLPRVWAI